MDYIRNSKNRKLKTQILQFFSRISFSTHRLGLAGKGITFCMFLLFLSLFFPWMSSTSSLGDAVHTYSAFSLYTWGIGYGIILALLLQSFFLLSHSRKENLRAYVPFRLSDAQAIVFIDAMIITATIHFLITSRAYIELTEYTFRAGFGLELALFGSLCLLIAAFFFSQSEKERAVKMSYLWKTEESPISGYEDILDPSSKKDTDEKNNMSLPI